MRTRREMMRQAGTAAVLATTSPWWLVRRAHAARSVSPVTRDRYQKFLHPAHLWFLNFEVERVHGLRRIEGQHQPLGPRLAGDPAAPPGSMVVVEGMVNRIIGSLRGHQHGGECRDVLVSSPGDEPSWVVCENVFP